MTADIDAVLSRLRERPECRDAVEVIERLTAERDDLAAEALASMEVRHYLTARAQAAEAERDRLRERMAAALSHCIGWHGSCCPCDGGPGGEEPCMDDLLGGSPVPDEPTAHAPETVPVGRYGLDHEALHVDIDSTIHLACNSDGRDDAHCDWVADLTSEIVRLLTAPSHPTGEERDT